MQNFVFSEKLSFGSGKSPQHLCLMSVAAKRPKPTAEISFDLLEISFIGFDVASRYRSFAMRTRIRMKNDFFFLRDILDVVGT